MWSKKKGCEKNAGFLVSVEIDLVTGICQNQPLCHVKTTPIFMKKIIVFFSFKKPANPHKYRVFGLFENIVDNQKSSDILGNVNREQQNRIKKRSTYTSKNLCNLRITL